MIRLKQVYVQDEEQLEGLGDTDDLAETGDADESNQQQLNQRNSDIESTNQILIDQEDYTEMTSNMKRRRTYTYGRSMHAWL